MSVYELVDAAQEDWSGDYLMVGNVNKKYYTLTNTKVVTNNIIAAAELQVRIMTGYLLQMLLSTNQFVILKNN